MEKTINDALLAGNDALSALGIHKSHLKEQIQTSKDKMYDMVCGMVAPVPKTTNRIQGVGQIVSNVLAIYEGVRIGLGVITAIRGTFRRKRR